MGIRERVNEKRIKIQIPKNQIHWVTTYTSDKTPKYAVTSDKMRTKYTLYKVNEDYSVTKIRTSVHPTFKEIYNNEE